MYKALLVVCAQALVQSISGQCIGAINGLGIAEGFGWTGPCTPIGTYFDSAWSVPFGNGIGPGALAASRGGGFFVTSSSPISPTGVSMTSENAYEGLLAVSGSIPFLGAVALEGAIPTLGVGAVTYGCGTGNVAMVSEDIAPGLGGAIGYDGVVAPFVSAGTFGYGGSIGCNGYAGPYGYGGLYGYEGFPGPYGYAGPYGGYGNGPWY